MLSRSHYESSTCGQKDDTKNMVPNSYSYYPRYASSVQGSLSAFDPLCERGKDVLYKNYLAAKITSEVGEKISVLAS